MASGVWRWALPRGAVWIYDLRTNLHFTLKENPLKRTHLDDFVACYSVKDRTMRKESERWKSFTYEELTKRDSRAERDSLPKAARRWRRRAPAT